MPNFKPHCSVAYHDFNGYDLETFAHSVSTGIYGHAGSFASPPVVQATLDAAIVTLHNTYEAYKNGGKAQKGDYLTARTTLMGYLDTTGNYVDELPGVNDDLIILAGFTPTKTGESQPVVPVTPTGITITRGASGEITTDCKPSPGATYYGAIVSARPIPAGFGINGNGQVVVLNKNNPEPLMANSSEGGIAVIYDLNKSRKKHFTGLTIGQEYYVYYYAANSAGVSQLSDPVVFTCW